MAVYTKQDYWNQISNNGKFRGMDYDQWLAANGGTDENFSHMYFDDDYLKEIEQYKNESWYQNLLTNPYLAGNNSQFSPSGWQKFKMGLGDWSAQDAYNANLQSMRTNWLSEFIEKMRQQSYNEPVQQVARQAAAGLNSDLVGGITSGSAAENDQPIQSVGMEHFQDGKDLQDILNVGTTLLGSVFSVVSNLQGLQSNALSNKIKSIEVSSNFQNYGKSLITDAVSDYFSGLDLSGDIGEIFEDGSYMSDVTSIIKSKIRNLPMSHKDRKRLTNVIDSLVFNDLIDKKEYTNWFQGIIHDSQSKLYESRNKRVKSGALPGAQESDSQALDFLSNEVYKPILDAEIEVQGITLKYQKDYFSTPGLGSAKGLSEKAQYQMNQDLLGVKKRLMSAFSAINKKIIGSKDLSPIWKIGLQAGVASAEAYSLSKLFGK